MTALVTIAAIEALRALAIRVPNPPAFLLPVVVAAAFFSGLRGGLLTSAVAIAYNVYAFSQPGHLGTYTRDDLVRVVLWAATTPGTAWMVGWLRDRLERVEHAALEASEARFSTAFSGSPVAMAVTRLRDGRVVQANDAFLKLLRLPSGSMPSESMGPSLVPPSRNEPTHQAELTLKAADGTDVLTLASFERIELGGEPCWLSFFHDITERRRLEDNLRQAQKMEAIGRLAGGIAHDFNNLLTVINANAVLLGRPGVSDSERTELVTDIRNAGERAAALTRQLLAFSRKQPLRSVPLSLNDLVRDAVPLLQRLLPENIQLSLDLAENLYAVLGDRSQLDQVLLNLVANARDALVRGGQLTIATSNLDRPTGAFACLTVRDTGAGIDPATLPHLFEPFYTTKSSGKGTGLGLATVYSVVKQAHGDITVDTEAGLGTTFRILLPRLVGASPEAPTPVEPRATRGSETILVAEDEPGVRSVVVRALSAQGYRVLEAANGEAALAVARNHGGRIDLLVTDVVMPGMTGRQLAQRLATERPGLLILYMSGHTNDPELDSAVGQRSATLLSKPFTPDVLGRAVRTLLDGVTQPSAAAS